MNISTVNELIDELGGTTAVAKLFGVGSSAVSNWRKAERFPAGVHYLISRLATERGIKLPKDFLPTLPVCLP